jgi:hypothetical protein
MISETLLDEASPLSCEAVLLPNRVYAHLSGRIPTR